MSIAFGSLFFAAPASATDSALEQAQAALVIAEQNLLDATAALQVATDNSFAAATARDLTIAEYDQAVAAWEATKVTIPGTTSTTTQNVVQNGTFDSTANWTNVVASSTVYTGGASPIIYNNQLKGSYTAGYYVQQTGTFPSPTRQVTFSADVWNYDTNEGNRINNPDYYRIEFRTYNAAGTRLNYYNLEWSQWHDWITRSATYTLSEDAVRWDIGFRMADSGYWAGAFGPVIDNVTLVATMGTTTPETYTYGQAETDAKNSAYQNFVAAQTASTLANVARSSAQTAADSATAEVTRLNQVIYDLTPRLNQPTNLRVQQLSDGQVEILWDAPAQSNVSVERYAIFFTTGDNAGWGIPATQTNAYLSRDIFAQTGGLDATYTFKVRSDNDTLAIYSEFSSAASLLVSAPVPTITPPAAGDYSAGEGGTIDLVAPTGKKFSTVVAWYGSPDDVSCGADVSDQVTQLINGLTSATVNADNSLGDTCGGVVKVLILSGLTYTDVTATSIDTVDPVVPPIVTPPVIEPQPQPQPIPLPVQPVPTPETPVIIEPTPTPTEEPVVEPEPTPTVEPSPTTPPTEEPAPTPTESSEPTPEPTEDVVQPLPEPNETAAPEVQPEPELSVEEAVAEIAILAEIEPEKLTDAQAEELKDAAITVLDTAVQGSPEYQQALEALAVVAQADDPELPAELAAIPGAAAVLDTLNALGNIGADMSPKQREESEKIVVSAIVVGQVAQMATAAAASAAAASSSSGSSGPRRRN